MVSYLGGLVSPPGLWAGRALATSESSVSSKVLSAKRSAAALEGSTWKQRRFKAAIESASCQVLSWVPSCICFTPQLKGVPPFYHRGRSSSRGHGTSMRVCGNQVVMPSQNWCQLLSPHPENPISLSTTPNPDSSPRERWINTVTANPYYLQILYLWIHLLLKIYFYQCSQLLHPRSWTWAEQ